MERNYELLLIIANDQSEEKRNKLVSKFTDMAGKKPNVEKWGLKKFATPINYKKDGYYYLINFVATNEVVAKMTQTMNITDGIERYMFIVKDEKMIEADKARKAKKAAMKAETATKTEETGE